jgi:hypothetical protein
MSGGATDDGKPINMHAKQRCVAVLTNDVYSMECAM